MKFDGSTQEFRIYLPNGKQKVLYYQKSKTDTQLDNRKQVLQECVLEKYQDYLYEHWVWEHKFEDRKFNFEDKTKALLDRCGSFILQGELKYGGILTYHEKEQIKEFEKPLSACGTDVQDAFDSVNVKDDDYTIDKTSIIHQKTNKKHHKKFNIIQNKGIFIQIDTENCFVFNKKHWKISDNCKEYQKIVLIKGKVEENQEKIKHIKISHPDWYDEYFPMWKVLCCIDCNGKEFFCNQKGEKLDGNLVNEIST